MDLICPTCYAHSTGECRKVNRDRRLIPPMRRLIEAAAMALLRLCWQALPELERVRFLGDLSVMGRRPVSQVSLYTMPLSDPGPAWGNLLERVAAARDLVDRGQRLLQLAHRVMTEHPGCRRPGTDSGNR